MNLAIYGAQGTALGAYQAIHNLYPIRKIECFLVTSCGDNAESLAGLPVLELDSYADGLSEDEKNNVEILIATPETVMQEIEKSLDKKGLRCHVRLTSSRFAQLQSFHCTCDKKFLPLTALPVGYHKADMHVFMAKFYKDKELSEKYLKSDWITPIQVGAVLCRERIANILDCEGEHISEKNVNYSELTALYWIWKNRLNGQWSVNAHGYYGLCHYRRILELSDDDVLRLEDNEVDVVLPYPMSYEPDIEKHHKRYIKDRDWAALLQALEELSPEYAAVFPDILAQPYLYNYNIMIAKKEVLAAYCSWLFPILERVEELSIPKGRERNDRYIGYMGETLATLYFMANRNRMNIVHAGCRFLT
ncbi:MAG: DUF4422 domain-containing protein [Lachnospiraceae bacterium]|nr:DUF4422 domain-containing protein [Lachnospiraceae bacterium]